MKVLISDMCRGNAKLFFKLALEECVDGSVVSLVASVEWKGVPLVAFPIEGLRSVGFPSKLREFIVMLPKLAVDIDLHVIEESPEGNALSYEKVAIQPRWAKWQSRKNGLLSAGAVDGIRNCDEARTLGRPRIVFRDCVTVNDCRGDEAVAKDCIYHASAIIPKGFDASNVVFRCMDEQFADVPVSFVASTPVRIEQSTAELTPYWEIEFSMRAPLALQGLVCCMCDKNDGSFLGFEALEAFQIDELKNSVGYYFNSAEKDERYHDWFLAHRAQPNELEIQRMTPIIDGPKFSIVVPLRETPLELFQAMAGSVFAQTYGDFELILVNASPENIDLRNAAESLAASDGRVKVVTLAEGRGIARTAYEGAMVASGDYIAFAGQADVLEPDLLYEYAKAICAGRSIDLLYCDEDRLGPDGRFANPSFKPDFSIDLLRQLNFVGRLVAVRADIVRTLPVPGEELEGAQDHDLVLRVAEASGHIHHVRKQLHHRRQTEQVEWSGAAGAECGSHAVQAGRLAVEQHLERLGLKAEVSHLKGLGYRVDYALSGNPSVSIIIPSKDHVQLLERCVMSILEKSNYFNYEIIIVENNSIEEETFSAYREMQQLDERIRVVEWPGKGFNFSSIVNYGVSQASGDLVLLLNNDIEVITPEWLDVMAGYFQRDEVGAVGAKLLYPDDTIQHAGIVLTGEGPAHLGRYLPREDTGSLGGRLEQARNVIAVTGACLMARREDYQRCGGMDEQLSVAYNDVDFCLKLRDAGKLAVFTPFVELYHHESQSRGYEDNGEKRVRLLRERGILEQKWAEVLVGGDPYSSPWFTQWGAAAVYCQLGF